MKISRRVPFALCVAIVASILVPSHGVHAGKRGTNADTAQQLSMTNVYIAPEMRGRANVHGDDANRLQRATTNAATRGVPVKVGIIGHYPRSAHSPTQAAQILRNYLDFSGVLILVTPRGIGVSSDQLSNADIAATERAANPGCKVDAGDCAIQAIHRTAPQVLAVQARANRNAAVFWVVSVGLFGVAILILLIMTRRKREEVLQRAPTGSPPTPTGT